ncbi:MAG: hypothetical protein EAZ98_18230 [Oscillatoriales cyanobacterium]|nr:MAG: hypothetical protein EAZ98_18230 [Oscillatoriales cyanobacterium]
MFAGDGDGETGVGVSGAGEEVDIGDEEGIISCLIGSDEGGDLGGNDGVSVVALDSDGLSHLRKPTSTPFNLHSTVSPKSQNQ